jgi:hypothetical protein
MSTFDATNHYFSGQGVVMIASRDSSGNPLGYRPIGNVSALSITTATTILDHKGSQDGQRAIDARLQTEKKPTVSMTMDSWISKNLAVALQGSSTSIAASTVTAESHNVYPGTVGALNYLDVSSVVLTANSTALTAYTSDTVAWDYKVNSDAGSFELNDGSSIAPVSLGVVPTAITVGSTTQLTLALPTTQTPVVGDEVYLFGFTGAGASTINGVTAPITAVGTGSITVGVATTGLTITCTTAGVLFLNAPIAVSAAYSYAAQNLTGALTQPMQTFSLRFEGLNTVESNLPVIVEVYKFSSDPLKELALISDTFGSFVIEGEALSDSTKTSGSKYFSIKTTE